MQATDSRSRAAASPQPTLNELQLFATLADELHFGRTARRLGMAQPSLSESLRRLETRLGLVLFERTSRHVALTEAGRVLLPAVRRVLDDLEAVRDVAATATSPSPGRQRATRGGRRRERGERAVAASP